MNAQFQPGNCPVCYGEREWGAAPGIADCHFCGYSGPAQAVPAPLPAAKPAPQPPEPTYVYNRKGSERGILTGGQHHCRLAGCTGLRLAVRWPDGRHTFPCTKGMTIRPDGQWQIES